MTAGQQLRYRRMRIEIESPDLETLLADPGSGVPWTFYLPPEEDEDAADEMESEAAAVVDQLVIRAARAARSPRPDEIVARGDLNARRISRILDNLVNNALKYSNHDKYLGVKLYRDNSAVKLEVADHGIGIARRDQSKIFE